jgi:hypothetical protein
MRLASPHKDSEQKLRPLLLCPGARLTIADPKMMRRVGVKLEIPHIPLQALVGDRFSVE